MPTKKKSAIDMLEDDHEKLRSMLDRLVHTSERGVKSREKVVHEIQHELEIHTLLEEEIFYPAVRDAAHDREGEETHFEAIEEHYLARDVELPRTLELDASTVEFAARSMVLRSLLTHHIQEEEERMFPRAIELIGEDGLMELGARMAERKRELARELKKAA